MICLRPYNGFHKKESTGVIFIQAKREYTSKFYFRLLLLGFFVVAVLLDVVFSVGGGGGRAAVVVSPSGGGDGLAVVVTFGGRDPSQFIRKVTDDVLPKRIIIENSIHSFYNYTTIWLYFIDILIFLHFDILTGLC